MVGCEVSREQLWSWIDRDAAELDAHLAQCKHCRSTAVDIRRKIDAVAVGAGPQRPLPETIGPYVVRRFLGEGGQALVYEAEQPELRRAVALKVLKGGRFASDRAVRRFQREARALGHLQHPGIAAVYDAGHTENGLHYFAMERVHGTPLDATVERLSLHEKLTLFASICEAVQFAHGHGVIHRDLKPSNIFVQEDGSPKILDFGLAKLLRSDYAPSLTATLVASGEGTPRYMSPEQALGNPEDIDERTDVYSLGVILYEMLTGRPPYVTSDLSPSTLRAVYDVPPPLPSSLHGDVDADLEVVLLKALENDPADRYPSVAAMASDVDRYLHARPIHARPPRWFVRTRRRMRHWRRWPLAAALAFLMVGAVGLRLTTRQPPDALSTRLTLLEHRRNLFRSGADPVVVSHADDFARRHGRLREATLLRAHALVITGQMNVAAVMLRSSLEDDPSHWYVEAMLHEIEARREKRDEQIEEIPFPDTAENWYLRSFASIDAPRALEFAAKALERDAQHVPSLAAMTLLSEAVDQHDDALRWASRLITATKQETRWMLYKSRLLFRLGRYQEALDEANQLVAIRPDDPACYHARARVARRLRDYDLAVRDLSKAIELQGANHPAAAWTYYHRGSAHWLNDQPDDAALDYRKTYELLNYPTYVNARLFLVLHDLGRSGEAAAELEEARRTVWDDPWLARILDCLAGEVSPLELIDSAETEKQLCEALYYAAEVHRLQGRLSEALDTFRACVALGVESDPDRDVDTMTEHELSIWRLSQLAPDGPDEGI